MVDFTGTISQLVKITDLAALFAEAQNRFGCAGRVRVKAGVPVNVEHGLRQAANSAI
jgi:hypothetical protein